MPHGLVSLRFEPPAPRRPPARAAKRIIPATRRLRGNCPLPCLGRRIARRARIVLLLADGATPASLPRRRNEAERSCGGEAGIRTLGRAMMPLQRFSKPPPQPLGHLTVPGGSARRNSRNRTTLPYDTPLPAARKAPAQPTPLDPPRPPRRHREAAAASARPAGRHGPCPRIRRRARPRRAACGSTPSTSHTMRSSTRRRIRPRRAARGAGRGSAIEPPRRKTLPFRDGYRRRSAPAMRRRGAPGIATPLEIRSMTRWVAPSAGVVIALSLASAPAVAAEGTPTWNGHVGEILLDNCASCHRPNQVAPMPLLSYRDAGAVGAGHQGQGRRARDAAVVRGPAVRRVLQRRQPARRGDRGDRRLGRRRRAGGRRAGPRAARLLGGGLEPSRRPGSGTT